MRAANTDLPISTLRECFVLDDQTGRIFWAVRPRGHFGSDEAWHRINRTFAGKPADTAIYTSGYRKVCVRINGDRKYQFTAHRVAYALSRGAWPRQHIDHIDRDRLNNRPANLRDVSHAENIQNSRPAVRGARRKPSGRWEAVIVSNGRRHRLGTFDREADAHAAYVEAKRRLHGCVAQRG